MKLFELGIPELLHHPHTKAIETEEFRPPRKGEWFLSGAIVQAYQAPDDLSTPYHIARLVRTETVERITEFL